MNESVPVVIAQCFHVREKAFQRKLQLQMRRRQPRQTVKYGKEPQIIFYLRHGAKFAGQFAALFGK